MGDFFKKLREQRLAQKIHIIKSMDFSKEEVWVVSKEEKINYINKYGAKHNVKLKDNSELSDDKIDKLYSNVKDAEENYDIVNHKYQPKK